MAHGTRNPRGRPGFRVGRLSQSSGVFEDLVSSHFRCVSIFLKLVLQMTPWSQQIQTSELCPPDTTPTRTRERMCVSEFWTVSWVCARWVPLEPSTVGKGVACQVSLPSRAGSGCVSAFFLDDSPAGEEESELSEDGCKVHYRPIWEHHSSTLSFSRSVSSSSFWSPLTEDCVLCSWQVILHSLMAFYCISVFLKFVP